MVVPPGVACQDEAGRLWDVLTMLRYAVRGQRGLGPEVRFAVHVRNDNRSGTPPLVRLKAPGAAAVAPAAALPLGADGPGQRLG